MSKKLLWAIGLGVFIRLFLAAFTYHSDLAPFDFAGKVIAKGNIANFYDYLCQLSDDDPILKIYPRYLFNFPPAPYFFLSGVSLLTTFLVNPSVHYDFIYNFSSILGNIQFNWLLLLLKLPYLLFDLGIAWLLYSYFDRKKNKYLALCLWLFNPVVLYAVYMISSFDIIPTFFVVLTLYFVKRSPSNNLLKEAFFLGVGGAFKIYPLMFLVPLALLKDRWNQRLKIIGLGMGVYFTSILPFIGSPGFRRTALIAGQTMKSFYAQIPLSGGEAIILWPAALFFLYFVFLLKTSVNRAWWKQLFMVTLIFFVFTHYHPQWFLWLMPFITLDLIFSNFKHWPLAVASLVSYVGLVFFFDPGLSIWLFAPLFPHLYGLPSIWQIIGLNPDYTLARSFLQTMFAASALGYFYFVPRKYSG